MKFCIDAVDFLAVLVLLHAPESTMLKIRFLSLRHVRMCDVSEYREKDTHINIYLYIHYGLTCNATLCFEFGTRTHDHSINSDYMQHRLEIYKYIYICIEHVHLTIHSDSLS